MFRNYAISTYNIYDRIFEFFRPNAINNGVDNQIGDVCNDDNDLLRRIVSRHKPKDKYSETCIQRLLNGDKKSGLYR